MRYLTILLGFGFLTSCSIYQRNFDCPPGEGVACTSVTTLEKMIVESPCGDDAFVGCAPKLVNASSSFSCKDCKEQSEEPFQRRIWIANKDGRPFYIYFQEEMSCDEQ